MVTNSWRKTPIRLDKETVYYDEKTNCFAVEKHGEYLVELERDTARAIARIVARGNDPSALTMRMVTLEREVNEIFVAPYLNEKVSAMADTGKGIKSWRQKR